MKNIFKYLNIAMLFIALSTVFTSCKDNDESGAGNLGLGIKVFFPTVVVPGQPMTINGSGFGDVAEIVFPGDIKVTEPDFEIVTDEMIRVKAPKGVSEGKIVVRNKAGETAESRLPLTVGHTQVLSYSREEGEHIKGNDLLTAYGKDMQFISYAEFIDEDGNALYVSASNFVHKAAGRVVIQVPTKVATDKFPVHLYTIDGQEFTSPIFDFETGTESEGHWEYKRVFIWENELDKAPSWDGTYRFGLDGNDPNAECLKTFDAATWAQIRDGEIYLLYTPKAGANVRVTTGWWTGAYGGTDYNCDEIAEEESDGRKTIKLNFKDEGSLYDNLDAQHLLFTGSDYVPNGIFILEAEWVEGGGGHFEKERTSIWKNDGSLGNISWSGDYRFGLEGHDGNNECAATFDEATWQKLKTEPFRIEIEMNEGAQVRVTDGWWSTNYLGEENIVNLVEEDENGHLFIEINLASSPALVDVLDDQHLLFTGDGYKVVEIYQETEIWVDGDGEAKPESVTLWENELGKAVSWSGDYRFGLDGNDGNNECLKTFDADTWAKIKDGVIYFVYTPTGTANVRITTGWWTGSYGDGDEVDSSGLAEEDGDGNMVIKINLKEEGSLYDNLDAQHLLFTGDAYIPVRIYYYK